MSLVIATGKNSSSSLPLWSHSDDLCDDGVNKGIVRQLGVATAVSADQTLRVLATQRPNVTQEYIDIRIRISPAAEPLTVLAPETSHRLHFEAQHDQPSTSETNIEHDPSLVADSLEPDVLFSSDSRFVSCLAPLPGHHGATVLVFHLTAPLSMSKPARPPVPSYIHDPIPASNKPAIIPVAAFEGSIATGMITGTLRQISAIEDMTASCRRFVGGPSILLLACRDGCIMGASYRPVAVAGVLYQPSIENGEQLCHDIRQLKHCTEWTESTGGAKGKLAAIYADGSVAIFLTQQAEVKENGATQLTSVPDLSVSIHPIRMIRGRTFICSEWLCGSYLALMRRHESRTLVECYAMAKDAAEPISTWELTAERLRDQCHSRIAVPSRDDPGASCQLAARRAALMYDPYSDCLAISGVKAVGSRDSTCSFACVWNWRSGVEGLLVAQGAVNETLPLSSLGFCRLKAGTAKLVHMFFGPTTNSRYQADIFDTAIMSPRANVPRPNGYLDLRERSNLVLSSHSVSFPQVTIASAKREFEVEWCESALPVEYIQGHGALHLAAVGRTFGRAIAVASAHGFCTLDCRQAASSDSMFRDFHSSSKLAKSTLSSSCRWRRFGKVAEEEAFSVLAFTWWEGRVATGSRHPEKLCHEDLLVAVIECREIGSDETGLYISCWTPKSLDLDHQLLFPASSARSNRWGIPLPKDFQPGSMDLLGDPTFSKTRKAILLLSDDSPATKFRVYQLQVLSEPLVSNTDFRDSLTEFVLIECVSVNEIGSPADLFLASGYYGFDLQSNQQMKPGFTATVGALRGQANGLDALSIDQHGVVSVGQILPEQFTVATEISAMWQADFFKSSTPDGSYEHSVVWLFSLMDGSVFSWFAPCAFTLGESERLVEPLDGNLDAGPSSSLVQPACRVLGLAVSAGKTTLWLDQNVSRPEKSLLLQTIPGSRYGSILASGQALHKFHRALGQDFEHDRFKSNFLEHETSGPSDFLLSFPVFLPSYYSTLLYCARTKEAMEGIWQAFGAFETTIRSIDYQDIVFQSLQLLTSRLVEKVGTLTKEGKSHRATGWILAAFVEFARYHTPPLQFASSFLEIGRQLEPCYFDSLFPLPIPCDDDDNEGEHVLDLYDLALDYGSTTTAASALPMLLDADILRQNCLRILRHCLDAIETYFDDFSGSGFGVVSEEQLVCGDVFRYALKLEDAGMDTLDDSFHTTDDESEATSNSSLNGKARFSIFCGMLGHSHPGGSRAIANGGSGQAHHILGQIDDIPEESGALVVGWYLTTLVFRRSRWKEAAALSSILIGESTSGLKSCSIPHLLKRIRSVRQSDILSFLPIENRAPNRLAEYFACALQACEAQNTGNEASKLFELLLILLGRSDATLTERSGLLFIALVASWVAGRAGELTRDDGLESEGCILLDAFQSALSTVNVHRIS